MDKITKQTNRLELQDVMLCLDILCRASATVIKTNPELSGEIMTITEILTKACNTGSKKVEEYFNELQNTSARLKEAKKEVITDLFTNEVLYEWTI